MPAATRQVRRGDVYPLERTQKEFSPKAITLPRYFAVQCAFARLPVFIVSATALTCGSLMIFAGGRAWPRQNQRNPRRLSGRGKGCGSFAVPSFHPAKPQAG
jgi:hypothetical protein